MKTKTTSITSTPRQGLYATLALALMLGACGSDDGAGGGLDNLLGGGDSGGGNTPTNPDVDAPRLVGAPRTRYEMANECWAIRANDTGQYLSRDGDSYTASAATIADAEPIFMKPSALGKYLLHDTDGLLLSADGTSLGRVARIDADDNAEFSVRGLNDDTVYPPTPAYHTEPTLEQVQLWSGFVEPRVSTTEFALNADTAGLALSVDEGGLLVSTNEAASFSFEPHAGCMEFPEANSDFSGTPFSGQRADGSVLGHVDAHVHISASEFLGGAEWGRPFHKFGVEHALGSCAVRHGSNGEFDFLSAAFSGDTDGHNTTGWPTFPDWPARRMLTHEAIYWKWLERSWAAGLRVVVNDLVDNETLCELQRNLTQSPGTDCNSMNNAGRQAGTMYGMENYIDAQYGGPGEGFFQIVHTPEEARSVIAEGKMAVILGIEISNLFDCKVNYAPTRLQQPFEEDGSGGLENSWGCTTAEGQPNSIDTQMQRAWDWGVRQLITIHEFDNAFGGNGIFDGLVLNLGNRENSGGILTADSSSILGLVSGDTDPATLATIVSNLPNAERPTGEWWTTYDCPIEGETEGFSGYLWSDSGGSTQEFLQQPLCIPTGQGGRSGGTTPCYPSGVSQCNARWMTPAGLYTYGKIMEYGFILDWDHMEMGMKTQLLELAEAQDITYPLVSTHGTFGGTTVEQAKRLLQGGGVLYPSNGSSRGFRNDMDETFAIWQQAMAELSGEEFMFGFGYGTDTNGLSGQTGPRGDIEAGKELVYPFTLFSGGPWDSLDDFDNVAGVVFAQPSSRDADGMVARTWHQDIDGNAHHGMLSDFVQEIAIEAEPVHLQHLFNAAEVYLRTWEITNASSAAIRREGLKMPADPILRPAPPEGAIAP